MPGTGFCELPVINKITGVTSILCYGPPHLLKPGEATNVLARLEPNPYPEDKLLLLLSQSVQLVDETKRPVPLSEVYFHHYASSYRFLGTAGTEFRGASAPIPAPYGRVINGSMMADKEWRQVNLEFVSQLGVAEEDRKQCVECWCDDKAQAGNAPFAPTEVVNGIKMPVTRVGSFLCCRQCPTALSHQPPTAYRMQYNLTYRVIKEHEHFIPLDMIVMYASGWMNAEYQIPEALGPMSTHVQVFNTTVNEICPQQQHNTMHIVRCQAHQHFAAQCMRLIDLDANVTICTSCPVFGTERDVPGNELDYVVHEQETDVDYAITPDTRLSVQSLYDSSEPRYGVMGLLWTWISNMSTPCRPDPGPDVPAEHYLPVGPNAGKLVAE